MVYNSWYPIIFDYDNNGLRQGKWYQADYNNNIAGFKNIISK